MTLIIKERVYYSISYAFVGKDVCMTVFQDVYKKCNASMNFYKFRE